MSHARVEEVSDSGSGSDPGSDSDPEEMDPSQLMPAVLPTRSGPPPPNAVLNPMLVPQSARDGAPAAREEIKTWACIYPVYFDAGRTRAEGRRIGKALAVENPLAREIADATQALGLATALEPGKTHPKDWANPGRVKVNVEAGGEAKIENKHHLYLMIAKWLRQNPTTEQTPFKLPVQGLPNTKVVPPAAPRGWKMGTILPLHSPAVTGGGVSENMFKDMMAELQGGEGGVPGLPGAAQGSGGEKKSKKDKKKNKA